MNNGESDKSDYVENNINFSEGFVYPSDDETIDIDAMAKELAESMTAQMLQRVIYYVLPSKNPRLTLAAMSYAAGINLSLVFQCANTQTAIAKVIGINLEAFSAEVQLIRQEFNLNHSTTANHYAKPETFKNHFQHPINKNKTRKKS